MSTVSQTRFFTAKRQAFTLVEMLVSITVLTGLILLITGLLNGAATITTTGNKRMDADNQARPVLDRMAQDLSQIVKRSDVDYLLKQPANPQKGQNKNTGKNDQIAFYSNVEGYFPTSVQSHTSLVAYRLNSSPAVTTASLNKLERLGKGLSWNGSSTTVTPIVFLPIPLASPAATAAWPQAGNMTADADGDYEIVGPQVFRFEYYYQLQTGELSDTPWDVSLGHSTVSGLRDVGAVIAVIAVIDPKSRLLVSDAQLSALAGQLLDYYYYDSPGNSGKVGEALTATWQRAVNTNSLNLPPPVLAGIRFYQRYFYLNGLQQ